MEKRKNAANLIVRESIETALVELLRKKSIGDITVSEIVKKAGVSRVSYYRNYYYKEDVLFAAMDKTAAAWKERTESFGQDIGEHIIELFEMERPLLETIYKNGLEHLMYKLIRKYCGLGDGRENNPTDNLTAYFAAFFAGAFFGWCDEWVKRGMAETPDEIKRMFEEIKNKQLANSDNA